jgi:hypothetical protein
MQIQPRTRSVAGHDSAEDQLCVPAVTFIEDAYRRAISDTLAELEQEEGEG